MQPAGGQPSVGGLVKHADLLDQACLHAGLMQGGLQVFKRALDEVYRLKIQAARKVFGQINRIAPTMPFTVSPPHPGSVLLGCGRWGLSRASGSCCAVYSGFSGTVRGRSVQTSVLAIARRAHAQSCQQGRIFEGLRQAGMNNLWQFGTASSASLPCHA